MGLDDKATVELLGKESETKAAEAVPEARLKGREREVHHINLALLTLEKVGRPLSMGRRAITLHRWKGRGVNGCQTIRDILIEQGRTISTCYSCTKPPVFAMFERVY